MGALTNGRSGPARVHGYSTATSWTATDLARAAIDAPS